MIVRKDVEAWRRLIPLLLEGVAEGRGSDVNVIQKIVLTS
jgi:hypothetical protein